MTIASSKNCIDCGKPLTKEEKEYYGHCCDACERIAFDKSLHDEEPDTYEVTTPPQGEPIRFPVTMVTLRDQFAMAALQGFDLPLHITPPGAEILAKNVFIIADAMLKAREQQ